jgi:F0F1-type ATP synthase membrane subunit c/vacuolar-type H+-ATPase subunit K
MTQFADAKLRGMWPVAICFLGWIGYGVWQGRQQAALLAKMATLPRSVRTRRATFMLLGSGAWLMGLLFVLRATGAMSEKGIAPWAWIVVGVGGLVFVHGQTMAGAYLISTAVTPGPREPSNQERSQSEEEVKQ